MRLGMTVSIRYICLECLQSAHVGADCVEAQARRSVRLGADFLIPAAKQRLANVGIAEFLEIVVDQLDVLELRRFLGNGR